MQPRRRGLNTGLKQYDIAPLSTAVEGVPAAAELRCTLQRVSKELVEMTRAASDCAGKSPSARASSCPADQEHEFWAASKRQEITGTRNALRKITWTRRASASRLRPPRAAQPTGERVSSACHRTLVIDRRSDSATATSAPGCCRRRRGMQQQHEIRRSQCGLMIHEIASRRGRCR